MPKRRRPTKPAWQLRIAKERIEILFDEAAKMASRDLKLANRYVQLARKIGMRYNLSLPRHLKRKVCSRCKGYLHPGISSAQRVVKGFIRIKCLSCGKFMRYPLRREHGLSTRC